jgi:serine/threonine protein kinase
MAEAHLALWGDLPGLRKLVVVKRILPHLSSNEQFVRMFFDEARISALLDHPNIPRIIEVGHDPDGYFIAMEAVSGKPLSAILRRARRRERPLGQAYAAYIIGRAAAGLGYAHALTDAGGRPLHIVHRDVSPENILVSFEGAVKLIDFGIARAQGRLSETLVGGLKGKVQYMSPEQAGGAPVDRRSDVFSLGIVLWEALSGRRLFRRETDLAVMRAITDEPIPRPSGPQPIPARLEEIVMTALEKSPDHRFQDAHEMALLLERHAFTTDGFDPAELVAQVKQLFPTDFAGWKATVAMAQGIEGRGRREITATFPLLAGAGTGSGTGHGAPTLALHRNRRREEALTEADPIPPFASEPPLELEDPSLPTLGSWGTHPEPESDSGAHPAGDAAAVSPRPRTSLRARLSGPLWLLVGAAATATAFASWRATTIAPAAASSIVERRPGPETPVASAKPTLAPPVTGGELSPPPAPAPDPSPVVKTPARKRASTPRATAASRSESPRRAVAAPEAAPSTSAPPARAPWSDPFE